MQLLASIVSCHCAMDMELGVRSEILSMLEISLSRELLGSETDLRYYAKNALGSGLKSQLGSGFGVMNLGIVSSSLLGLDGKARSLANTVQSTVNEPFQEKIIDAIGAISKSKAGTLMRDPITQLREDCAQIKKAAEKLRLQIHRRLDSVFRSEYEQRVRAAQIDMLLETIPSNSGELNEIRELLKEIRDRGNKKFSSSKELLDLFGACTGSLLAESIMAVLGLRG